jgi:hypothetical protein
MATTFLFLGHMLDRFERWFNTRFGWFFTNGMKATGERRRMFRA